jgi:hypothetical protein
MYIVQDVPEILPKLIATESADISIYRCLLSTLAFPARLGMATDSPPANI